MTEIDKKKSKTMSKGILALIIVILIIIATFAATVYFAISTYLSFKQTTIAKQENEMNQSVQIISETSQSITRSAEKLEESLNTMSKGQDIERLLNGGEDEAIENALTAFKSFKDTYKEVGNVFLGTQEKKMYLYPQVELPDGYDPTERVWYTNTLKNKGLTWSEPYIDAIQGNAIITLSLPVYNEDQLKGVIAADLNLDLIVEDIKNIKLGETGYMLVTDQNGNIIFHPDRTLIGQTIYIEELKNIKATGDIGSVAYEYQGIEKTAIYSKIDKLNLNLIGIVNK